MKFIILKSYYTSKDRIILKDFIKRGSSLCATLGYLLEFGTFNPGDDVLILSEDTDSVQIRPKAIYKNNKGYYIRIYKAFVGRNIEWRINPYSDYFDVDTLYDLIQAGLVEKVEGKQC